MQKIVRSIVWGCLAIIPFIALYIADGSSLDVISWFGSGASGMFFPFISGKNVLFRILVEAAFAGWAVLAIADAKYRVALKKSPVVIAYGVFILVLLLADLFGVDREKSMWSNFERMEGFVGHIHLFAYFFVLSAMLRSLEDWRRMFKVFLAADLLVVLYAVGQFIGAAKPKLIQAVFPHLIEWSQKNFAIHGGGFRLDATLGNSAYFGVFCLVHVFIAMILWFQSKHERKNLIYGTLVVLNVLGVFYSGTRGTMIGLVVGAFLTFALLAWKGSKKTRKAFAVTSITFLILTAGIFAFKDSAFVKSSSVLSRIATISPNDVTGASRIAMWKISYAAWLERPILGYGQDNFGYIFARKFLPQEMCNLEPWYDRSHNVFFDWLVAAGTLGLLSYLSLYGVTLMMMWKKGSVMNIQEKALITGLLAGYFIHNFFVFDNLTSYILFALVLAYVAVRHHSEETVHGKSMFDKDQMNLLVLPIIGIAFLVTFYYINYRPIVVNRLVIRAMSIGEYAKTMPLADAVKLQQNSFVDAIAMNTLGSSEAREQFMQMAIRMAQIKIPDSLPQGDKQAATQALNDLLQAARKDVATSYEVNKNDVRMLSIYGMFLNGIGDPVSAEKVLVDAHTLAPNKQLISFDLIRARLLGKRYEDAYALGRDTYDLSITCQNALKWYMISAGYAGKYEEARAYALTKGQDPGLDPDVIAGVIASGQTTVAIKLLEEVKKANPASAPQVDAYIKQLLQGKGI